MANGAQASSHETLASLQAGRALAATLVACFHAAVYIFALPKYWGYDPSRGFFNFGHAGVEFFFVLSGFIIFYIHRRDLGQPSRFTAYATKRLLRIYPMYWVVLAFVLCVYALVPSYGMPGMRERGTIISSLLLIHVDGTSATELASAWTLYHEMLFYGLFAIAILRRRLGFALMGLWLAGCCIALFFPPHYYPLAFVFSPLHLLFGMGMLACLLLTRSRIGYPGICLLAGALIFMAAAMEEDFIRWLSEMPRNLMYGAASALALAGAVELERQGRLKIPSPLVLAGNASYSVYLVNFAVLSCLAKIFVHLGAREHLPAPGCYFAITTISIALGILAYVAVERPMLHAIRNYLRERHTRKSSAFPYALFMKLRTAAQD